MKYSVLGLAGLASANVVLNTGRYPGEVSWKLKDKSGAVLCEGGPYNGGRY